MDVSLQTIALWALPVVFAITLHEAAHGYVAKTFGDRTAEMQGRITLNPLKHIDPVGTILVPGVLILAAKLGGPQFVFGWAKPVPVNFGNLRNPKRDMLWVAAAGPGANFAMALLWALLLKVAAPGGALGKRAPAADGENRCFGQPGIDGAQPVAVPPLDGGRIAVSLLPCTRRTRMRASSRTACSSSSACWRSGVLDNVMAAAAARRRMAAAGVARAVNRSASTTTIASMFADRVLSGMRPTGRMHIGHYHGALKNWIRLQEEYECLFFAADWHALTTHYDAPETIAESVWDMFIDWLAAGVDPTRATLFIQSRVPEHAELTLLLGMITPLGWLERVPTYKDQQQKLDRPRPLDLRLPRLSGAAERRHPDLPREQGAGRRGPGVAHRVHARGRAALQPHLRPRAGLRGQGARGGEEARQQEGEALRGAAHRVPGAGRHAGARGRARAARGHAEPVARRPRAAVRLPRRLAPRDPAGAAAAADRNAARAGPRRPEDVEVLRQRDHAARRSGVGDAEDPDDADRSGARAAHRSGRPGEVPGLGAAPGLLERRRRATGSCTAARPRASAASNASSR